MVYIKIVPYFFFIFLSYVQFWILYFRTKRTSNSGKSNFKISTISEMDVSPRPFCGIPTTCQQNCHAKDFFSSLPELRLRKTVVISTKKQEDKTTYILRSCNKYPLVRLNVIIFFSMNNNPLCAIMFYILPSYCYNNIHKSPTLFYNIRINFTRRD